MSHLRALIVLVGLALIGGWFLWAGMVPQAGSIAVSGVTAAPVSGQDGALRVFLTIGNDGPADRLVGVHAPDAASARLVMPDGVTAIPLPSGSAPVLAADGAHILLEGLSESIGHGGLIPVTLVFEAAGEVSARATVVDPLAKGGAEAAGLFGAGDICQIGDGEPAPKLALTVTKNAQGSGWEVAVATEQFTFSRPIEGMGHVPGYGHGHLYLNGVKLQRMYEPKAQIGALPPGKYEISVTLNTNDHRAYVVGDVPVYVADTINSE